MTDVAKAIDVPRATTFRLLMTLEEEGIVDRQETLYSPGWDLSRMALSVDPASRLVPRIQDLLDDFAEEIGETATFSLRRGRYELDFVLQSTPRRMGVTVSEVQGVRWPHHASATGKLLLAELTPEQVRLDLGETLEPLTEHTITDFTVLFEELEQIRQQGWAGTLQELEDGVISFSVPVRDSIGTFIGAISCVGPLHRMEAAERYPELISSLHAVSDRIRQRLSTSAEG